MKNISFPFNIYNKKQTSVFRFLSYSQQNLFITSSCDLKCSFCKIWQQNNTYKDKKIDISKFANSNSSSKFFPFKKKVNIVGGDPLNHKDLAFILSSLKKNNIKTNVWTPGVSSIDNLYTILPYTDEFTLYFPAPDKDLYRIITGSDSWDNLLLWLQLLKEEKKPVIFNFPVLNETVQYLPYAYELAWQYKSPIILHYFTDNLSKDSIAYIKRFKYVKNVIVFKNKIHVPRSMCAAFPLNSFNNYLQVTSNIFDEITNSVRPMFKL
jgi:organic radical activating enzyme